MEIDFATSTQSGQEPINLAIYTQVAPSPPSGV